MGRSCRRERCNNLENTCVLSSKKEEWMSLLVSIPKEQEARARGNLIVEEAMGVLEGQDPGCGAVVQGVML